MAVLRKRLLYLVVLGCLMLPGIALGCFVLLAHSLVVLHDCQKSDVAFYRSGAAQFVPDDASGICFAGRPARLWFVLRFECDEATFVEWFEGLGFKVEPLTERLKLRDTFDFYYLEPPRQTTIVNQGSTATDTVAGLRIVAVYDREKSVGYVSGNEH